jgi:hypothetical protein
LSGWHLRDALTSPNHSSLEATPEQQLTDTVSRAARDDLQKKLLREIVGHPDGILLGPAAAAMSAEFGQPVHACNEALLDLMARGVVTVVDDESGARFLVADFVALGLPVELRDHIVAASMPVALLGGPHSPGVLEQLREDLQLSTEQVYVCIDTQGPDQYEKDLVTRSQRGGKTVFLIPHRRDMREDQRQLYDDTVRHWEKRLRDAGVLRRNVDVRIMRTHRPELIGSAISSSRGRIRLRSTGPLASKAGSVISVDEASSAYLLLYGTYREQLEASDPLMKVWPLRFIRSRVSQTWLIAGPLLLAAAVWLTGFKGAVFAVLAAFIINVASNVAPIPKLNRARNKQLF